MGEKSKLKECPRCHHRIPHFATHCGSCGWTGQRTNYWFLVVAALLALSFLGYMMYNDYMAASPKQEITR